MIVVSEFSIFGAVRVLFVSVSAHAIVAKSQSVRAELNCAVVHDTVFEPSEIVLFVRVSNPAKVAKSPSVNAVLNCAVFPDRVFEPREIVLLVRLAVALFFVASDVLSTLESPTCAFVTE